MKKIRKNWFLKLGVLAAAVCSIGLISGLAACGGEDNPPSQPASYSITAPAGSEVYTVTGLPETAQEGDTVSFKVTLTDPENSVLNEVRIEPTFDASFDVTPAADGTYTFTMPDGPVKIIVDATAFSEVLSDGGVIFGEDNATELVIGATNGGYLNEDNDYVEAWEYNIDITWVQTANLSPRSSVTSSNQAVIPDSAIYFEAGDKGSSAYFSDVQVYIDTTQISEGSTWLSIYLDSNETSSNGTVCVKITVVDSVELETMPESVVIDFDGYAEEGDDILVRFYDSDYIENSTIDGQPAPQYIQVAGKVGADGKATFSFDYVIGHSYSISIYKGTEWYTGQATNGSEAAQNTLVLGGDVVGQGSTLTGFDQYVDGELSFVNPSSSLELTVEGTFQEINWG